MKINRRENDRKLVLGEVFRQSSAFLQGAFLILNQYGEYQLYIMDSRFFHMELQCLLYVIIFMQILEC